MLVDFELADTLFARAELLEPEHPWLWLGAGTMLRFEEPTEAIDLLGKRRGEAERIAKQAEDVLFYLRQQITTAEVSMARLYNLAVSLRPKAPQSKQQQ